MIHKAKDKVWHDHRGNEVPREYVPELDRKNEIAVAKIFKDAERLNQQLVKFKQDAFELTDQQYAAMLKSANIAPSARKGNYTLTSFDKSVKIEVNVSDKIDFDDNISLAQEKLNEFKKLKMTGTDKDITVILNHAFTTRKGRLDKARVFDLMQYDIKHPLWIEGIELIRKAITVNSSVRYMEISYKDDEGRYIPVKLNFATL